MALALACPVIATHPPLRSRVDRLVTPMPHSIGTWRTPRSWTASAACFCCCCCSCTRPCCCCCRLPLTRPPCRDSSLIHRVERDAARAHGKTPTGRGTWNTRKQESKRVATHLLRPPAEALDDLALHLQWEWRFRAGRRSHYQRPRVCHGCVVAFSRLALCLRDRVDCPIRGEGCPCVLQDAGRKTR